MKCIFCKKDTIPKEIEYSECGKVVGTFPAEVCTGCNEPFFSSETAKKIQEKSETFISSRGKNWKGVATMAKIGEKAPEFECTAYANGKFDKVSLQQYSKQKKWVVLFFYPLDFTFVCPTEIEGFQKKSADFTKLNTIVIGASTDSEHSHRAWFQRDLPDVKYPVLADTTHKISRDYGVLKEDQGIAYRGTFIIDPEGILRYMVISDLSVGRSVEETLRVVQALQSGGLCPAEWKPGQKHLEAK